MSSANIGKTRKFSENESLLPTNHEKSRKPSKFDKNERKISRCPRTTKNSKDSGESANSPKTG